MNELFPPWLCHPSLELSLIACSISALSTDSMDAHGLVPSAMALVIDHNHEETHTLSLLLLRELMMIRTNNLKVFG